MITTLKPNQVFVFGSNEAGIHGAGAAYTAYKKFGARIGRGEGHYGQSYAIPTKDKDLNVLPIGKIKPYVKRFLDYAKDMPDLQFLVTAIGCGLAGYKPEQIAPLFKDIPENVVLPEEFLR